MGSGPKVTRLLSAGHLGGPTAANNNDDYKNYIEETDQRTDIRHYCPAFHQTKRLYAPWGYIGGHITLKDRKCQQHTFRNTALTAQCHI